MTTRSRLLQPSRRLFLQGTAAFGAASLAAPSLVRAQSRELYINSWGGPWLEAAQAHLFEPFTAQTGIAINAVSPVSFAKLAQQVQTGIYEFDVTTLGGGEIVRANQAGLLEDIPAPYDGGLFENGAASHAFATMLAWRTDKGWDATPQSWADFWDVERFPGARSLQRYPARVLPLALLADGVAMEDLYPLDIDRAFAKLDEIKPYIQWWETGAQPLEWLSSGSVAVTAAYNGRIAIANQQGGHFPLIWNQQLYSMDYWTIVKGSKNKAAANAFITYANGQAPQQAFSQAIAYGVTNKALSDKLDPAKAPWIPTSPQNMAVAVPLNIEYWVDHGEELEERLNAWLAR